MQRPPVRAGSDLVLGVLGLLACQVECRRDIGVQLRVKGLGALGERLDVFNRGELARLE